MFLDDGLEASLDSKIECNRGGDHKDKDHDDSDVSLHLCGLRNLTSICVKG